eukprot:scaffold4484_cov170-Amphora_coffeaeformis.AAC.6
MLVWKAGPWSRRLHEISPSHFDVSTHPTKYHTAILPSEIPRLYSTYYCVPLLHELVASMMEKFKTAEAPQVVGMLKKASYNNKLLHIEL